MEKFGGVFSILLGLIFVIYHKKMGVTTQKLCIESFKVSLTDKVLGIVYLIGGIIFTIFGVLMLVGTIK